MLAHFLAGAAMMLTAVWISTVIHRFTENRWLGRHIDLPTVFVGASVFAVSVFWFDKSVWFSTFLVATAVVVSNFLTNVTSVKD